MQQEYKMSNSRTTRRYRDMHKYKVRVQYNSMGEPIKTKVRLDKQRHGRKVERQCPMDTMAPLPIQGQSKTKVCDRNQFDEDLLHSTSNLSRVTCVLREILFGKVGRDMIHSKSNFASLPDVLRFYCRITYGAMTIAEERRIDLFHTILVLQGSSPLLRVMKRLLHIPGIKPFSHRISAVYFEIWAWLIENDAIADVDDAKNTLDLMIPSATLLQCVQTIGTINGNQFSPLLLAQLRTYLQGLTNSLPGSIEMQYHNDEVIDWINIDTALEGILNIIEKEDKSVEEIENELFSNRHAVGVVLPSTSTREVSEIPCKDNNFHQHGNSAPLASLQILLHKLIAFDPNRDGILEDEDFCNILREWYEASCNILYANKDHCDILLDFFGVPSNSENGWVVDYISFLGTISAFINESYSIPDIQEVETYIHDSFRGVDRSQLDFMQRYVETVRLKMDEKSFPVRKKAVSERRRIVNSRRALSRIRPYQNETDFFTQWVGAAACSMGERVCSKDELIEPSDRDSSGNRDTGQSRRPKTPLHLVQPLQDSCFDEVEHGGEDMDVHKNMSDPSYSKTLSKAFDASSKAEATMDTKPSDGFVETPSHRVGTNIYVRFPAVEPLRTVLKRDNTKDVRCPCTSSINVERMGSNCKGGDSLDVDDQCNGYPSCDDLICEQALVQVRDCRALNRSASASSENHKGNSITSRTSYKDQGNAVCLPKSNAEKHKPPSASVNATSRGTFPQFPLCSTRIDGVSPTDLEMEETMNSASFEDPVKMETSQSTNFPIVSSTSYFQETFDAKQSDRNVNIDVECNMRYCIVSSSETRSGSDVAVTKKTNQLNAPIGNIGLDTRSTTPDESHEGAEKQISSQGKIGPDTGFTTPDESQEGDEKHVSTAPLQNQSLVLYGPSILPSISSNKSTTLGHCGMIPGMLIPRSISIVQKHPLDMYLREISRSTILKMELMRNCSPQTILKPLLHPAKQSKEFLRDMVLISVHHQEGYPSLLGTEYTKRGYPSLPGTEYTCLMPYQSGSEDTERKDINPTFHVHQTACKNVTSEERGHELYSVTHTSLKQSNNISSMTAASSASSSTTQQNHDGTQSDLVSLWLIDKWLWDEYFESSNRTLHKNADYAPNREILRRLSDRSNAVNGNGEMFIYNAPYTLVKACREQAKVCKISYASRENLEGASTEKYHHFSEKFSRPRQATTSIGCKPSIRMYGNIRPVVYRIS